MPRLVDLVVTKDREITPTNLPELISKEFAAHGPKMNEELFRKHMQNTTLNLYPTSSTPSSSTAIISTADLQYQLYLNMKSKPQEQAADPELWEILKAKFLALGWHLEEIHVPWAHLEKKRTRLRLYTKNHEELFTQSMDTASHP
ncbi:hypothetical protein Tco_0082728 [Tanacetum coccineum]